MFLAIAVDNLANAQELTAAEEEAAEEDEKVSSNLRGDHSLPAPSLTVGARQKEFHPTYFFPLDEYDIMTYCQVSNIRCTLVGNWIVDHSDVVGASPVGAAPTTSSFSTNTWLQRIG